MWYSLGVFDSSERRRHARTCAALDLKYSSVEGGPVLTMGRDASSGGVAFETAELCRPEDVLRVRFGFPESSAVFSAEVKVVRAWREGPSNYVAAEFLRMPPEERAAFLEHLQPA